MLTCGLGQQVFEVVLGGFGGAAVGIVMIGLASMILSALL